MDSQGLTESRLSPPPVPVPPSLPIQLAWLIPCYGVLGMAVSLPWASGWIKRSGPRPAAYLNLLLTLVAVIHGGWILRLVGRLGPQHLEFSWFGVADLHLQISFELSFTTLACLALVTLMSLVTQVFALGYLDKEWSLARFYALLGFFEGAMAGVVLSSNLFISYFLLEMLTLSTYLLVGFWYAQPLVVTAARDAFFTKRVGDVLLLMGVVSLSVFAGSLEFTDLYRWAPSSGLSPVVANLLGLGLIAGPIGKCAQFPMHLWLDEAMEGPNPASILRNSVVVTCGALVLLKLMPLLQISPLAVTVLLIIGIISALGGALVAIAQVDLKRAFSYSTTSYLGLVFIAIALQQPLIALLLLFSHGMAKALMFMSVGSVISTTNCQDLTELGGLAGRMPATTTAFLAAAAGLTGILPLGCFWALTLMVQALHGHSPLATGTVLVTHGLTAFNLVRVYRQVFLGPSQPKTRRTPEVGWLMALPMVGLMVIVLLTPWLMMRLGLVSGIIDLSPYAALAVVITGLLGALAGFQVDLNKSWSRSVQRPLRLIQDLLGQDFYTEQLYQRTIVTWVATLASLTDRFDRQVVSGLVNRIGSASMASAEALRLGVSGQLQTYVLTIIVAILLLFSTLSSLHR